MTDTGQAKKFPVTEDIKDAMALIKRGTDTLLDEEELEQKLARSKATIPKPRSYGDLPCGRLHQRDR